MKSIKCKFFAGIVLSVLSFGIFSLATTPIKAQETYSFDLIGQKGEPCPALLAICPRTILPTILIFWEGDFENLESLPEDALD